MEVLEHQQLAQVVGLAYDLLVARQNEHLGAVDHVVFLLQLEKVF